MFKVALSKSLILSVDMAHAVHPNYASKHEAQHAPKMNHGIVIKSNANQRYATNGVTGFFARELARSAGVPVQVPLQYNLLSLALSLAVVSVEIMGLNGFTTGICCTKRLPMRVHNWSCYFSEYRYPSCRSGNASTFNAFDPRNGENSDLNYLIFFFCYMCNIYHNLSICADGRFGSFLREKNVHRVFHKISIIRFFFEN